MLPDLCWGVYQGMVWAVYHTLLSFVIINATSSRIIIVAPSCVLSFTSSSASSPHPSLIPNLMLSSFHSLSLSLSLYHYHKSPPQSFLKFIMVPDTFLGLAHLTRFNKALS